MRSAAAVYLTRVFARCKHLNKLGYGMPGSALKLNLVYNPLGASLPPDQSRLEADYKRQLRENFSIEFHRLFTLANMPIKRFADFLDRSGKRADYMKLLVEHFNPATVSGLMCRSLVSVGWDGVLYDCDFNQMLEIGMDGLRLTVWDLAEFQRYIGTPHRNCISLLRMHGRRRIKLRRRIAVEVEA